MAEVRSRLACATLDDATLVVRAREGDVTAFEDLVRPSPSSGRPNSSEVLALHDDAVRPGPWKVFT